jgi:hypothetical protein
MRTLLAVLAVLAATACQGQEGEISSLQAQQAMLEYRLQAMETSGRPRYCDDDNWHSPTGCISRQEARDSLRIVQQMLDRATR